MLKCAVIGLGNMGKNHVRVLSEINDIELVAVCDNNLELAKEFSKKYNIKYYANYRDVLNEHPDFVSIVVPTIYHYEVAKFFIEHDTHVLVEKPVTKTIEEVDELIKLSCKYNVKVMVGHIERFNSVIKKIKEIIDNNDLGKIISFSAKRVGLYPPQIPDSVILDIGIHDIDIFNMLFGIPNSVYCVAENSKNKKEDCSITILKYNNMLSGVIESNWLTPYKIRKINITGTKSVIEADLINGIVNLQNGKWDMNAKINKEEPLKLEIQHFINCILDDKNPLITLEDGKNALKIALNAIESNKYNKVIDLE